MNYFHQDVWVPDGKTHSNDAPSDSEYTSQKVECCDVHLLNLKIAYSLIDAIAVIQCVVVYTTPTSLRLDIGISF